MYSCALLKIGVNTQQQHFRGFLVLRLHRRKNTDNKNNWLERRYVFCMYKQHLDLCVSWKASDNVNLIHLFQEASFNVIFLRKKKKKTWPTQPTDIILLFFQLKNTAETNHKQHYNHNELLFNKSGLVYKKSSGPSYFPNGLGPHLYHRIWLLDNNFQCRKGSIQCITVCSGFSSSSRKVYWLVPLKTVSNHAEPKRLLPSQ